MSKLQELMQKLCPDGVEYRRLGDKRRVNNATRNIVD